MNQRHQGFTLLESLLVLFCISIFFTVPFIMVKHWKEQIEVEMFFNQLERSIEKTHQSAILEGIDTTIEQINKQKFKFIYEHHGVTRSEYLEVEPPLVLRTNENITFKGGTGNISKIEHIKIEDRLNDRIVTYKFQFGSGKVIKNETR